MGVYIEMIKEHESPTGVRYRAERRVAGEPYAWKAGKVRYHLVKKVGVFEFAFATEELAFLEERSDDVFLETEAHQMRCFIEDAGMPSRGPLSGDGGMGVVKAEAWTRVQQRACVPVGAPRMFRSDAERVVRPWNSSLPALMVPSLVAAAKILPPRPRPRDAAAWPSAVRAAVAMIILFILIPAPAAGQVVRGRVVDAQSGAAVALARVVVTGTGQGTRRTTTAADGRFSVRLRRGGSFRVQVTRAGYAPTRTGSRSVGAHDTVDVDVRVSAAAHRLEPLTVTGRARRLKVLGRFYETPDTVIARAHVVGQSRSVRARGTFPTPDLCYHLSGNAHREQSVITLTVQARGKSELCAGVGGGFVYDVAVRRLPPGVYTVRVLHDFQDGAGPPAMVLDTTLTVR